MNYLTSITVDDSTGDIFNLFKDQEGETERSNLEIKKEGSNLIFLINAKDAVSLRASFNSITKLFTVYENMSGIEDE